MKSTQNEAILGHVRQLFGAGTLVGMAEGQLLERFSSRRDEAAFELSSRGTGRWSWASAGGS